MCAQYIYITYINFGNVNMMHGACKNTEKLFTHLPR